MGVGERKIKRKSGKVTRSRTYRILVDTGERYANGKKKYKQIVKSLGPIEEVSSNKAKTEYHKESAKYQRRKNNQVSAPTFNDYSVEYINHVRDVLKKRSWKRDQLSIKWLAGYFGESLLEKITSSEVLKYQRLRLAMGKKPATVNREVACLRHMLNLARLMDYVEGENPVRGVRMLEENNQVERVLTQKEQDILIAASPPHLRAIILCALNTGMRQGEIFNLKWQNVNLKQGILVIESAYTKNKTTRRVPINSTLREVLSSVEKVKGSEFVFNSPLGDKYSGPGGMKRSFSTACKRAGITHLRFHDLRHTAATRMIEAGASIVDVAKILGHSSLKMTMRYAHPEDSLKVAVELLSGKNYNTNYNNHS